MSRYPRAARSARLKCIDCNAPIVETVGREFVCVDCGEFKITSKDAGTDSSPEVEAEASPDTGADPA